MGVDGWHSLKIYGSLWEAELDAGRLESAGIPSVLDRRGAVGVLGPGHPGASVFGVSLLVPDEKADQAREVLGLDVPQAEVETSDEE